MQDGVSGFIAASPQDFIARIKQIMAAPQLHRSLRLASRLAASRESWETVPDELRLAYDACTWRSTRQEAGAILTTVA